MRPANFGSIETERPQSGIVRALDAKHDFHVVAPINPESVFFSPTTMCQSSDGHSPDGGVCRVYTLPGKAGVLPGARCADAMVPATQDSRIPATIAAGSLAGHMAIFLSRSSTSLISRLLEIMR
jgi:hypothetical protein